MAKDIYEEDNKMERPFVVCHMAHFPGWKDRRGVFSTPETAPALKAYGELRGFYGCQATVYGTATMLGGYADGRVPVCLPPNKIRL